MNIYSLALFLLFISTSQASYQYYEEGESANVECVAPRGEVKYWFLHGKGKSIGIRSDADQTDVFMNPNGTLQFQNVSKAKHEGDHVCVVSYEKTLEAYSVRMDIKPLPLTNLWEARYRGMFVTGFIAAFICLILFAGFCLVHKYRYRIPLTKIENSKLEKSYVNQGLTNDEEECNVRM